MRENKYDDPHFFALYSAMPRSVQGLAAAGEWPVLRKLLPPLEEKRVLDLGCGFGWHCRYAAEQGATSVVGVDLSEKMLDRARKETPFPNVTYIRSGIEDFAFGSGVYDVVISSLALHYVASFVAVCRQVRRSLSPGGKFVFSVEHPVFTAQGAQDWHYDGNGKRCHWPVDDYFDEGPREAVFLGEKVSKYHKTLTTYINGLLDADFSITALVEPEPSPDLVASLPDMRDELRRPMMLILAATAK
ncbi:MAG: class I SAM-dependent methyltransferase [Deltaproteobacteria bacterium]|nr:class I SAM-dependent methyltransferase [Deltaproteobacteria bacterium]